MARQGETAAFDEQLRDRVGGLFADLTLLVHHAALEAVREALGRAQQPSPAARKRRSARTREVELVPTAPPEPWTEPPQPVPGADATLLRAVVVKHALTALVVEERVPAEGKGRGMRYRLVEEEAVVELVPVGAPAKEREPVVAEGPVSGVPTGVAPSDPARAGATKLTSDRSA